MRKCDVGVTRAVVIDIIKEMGVSTRLGGLSLVSFDFSLVFFATSTACGVMPIAKINGNKNNNRKWSFIRSLMKLYWSKHFDPD